MIYEDIVINTINCILNLHLIYATSMEKNTKF